MRPQAVRRLAADLSNLHSEVLPPNYLFAPGHDEDDLTQLDILLAGPQHTPFSEGVWRLHLSMPDDYPAQPPTANFRTTIFHPNVHPETGGVCVETLKRDWDSKLTLRDVLITISCLLIQPNPDSALNAEAGSMIQEDYEIFARRARLMTSIHAGIPGHLAAAVREARSRGQEMDVYEDAAVADSKAPIRQRRQMRAPQRTRARRSDGSPAEQLVDRRQVARVQHQEQDDVFAMPQRRSKLHSDELMSDADQENHGMTHLDTPMLGTPRRPPGPPVPLGELTMDSDDEEMESEYPPSPRKSPSKSPVKRQLFANLHAESSKDALRLLDHTPTILGDTTLNAFSTFETPILRPPQPQFLPVETPSSIQEDHITEEQLWELCGKDIARWNRGDFDGQPFEMIAARW